MAKIKGKQEIILRSGIDIFIEKGFSKTKVADIAKNAGIGKGTVYEYFDSKDSLFKGCIDYILDSHINELTEAMSHGVNGIDNLKRFAHLHFKFVCEKNNALYYFQKECNEAVEKSIRMLMLEYRNKSLGIIESIIIREMNDRNIEIVNGFRPYDMALIYMGAINQFSIDRVLLSDSDTIFEDNKDDMEAYVEGILKMAHKSYIKHGEEECGAL